MARTPKPNVKAAFLDGEQTLIANLSVYKKNMNDAVADGLRKFGGRIESESTKNCPAMTGELRSRVFNEGPLLERGTYTQVVGYEKFGALWGKQNAGSAGKPYALPVHERTYAAHKVGGAKFLERALTALSGQYKPYMQKLLGQVRL